MVLPSTTMPTPDSLMASGRSSEKLSLPSLQSKMKVDPESYTTELDLLHKQFSSALFVFEQQAAMKSAFMEPDPTITKDLGDLAMFLSHVMPSYPEKLGSFPANLIELLRTGARTLPSSLRCQITQALILLVNRQMVDIEETLTLFMALQTLGDRILRKMTFSHVVHSIRRMNCKHRNDAKNRSLQNVLFAMLMEEDESRAKRALIVLCDLHRRKVWFDERTANAICTACFHKSSRIMKAALSFLLGYERVEEGNESDGSSSEDDTTEQKPHVVLSRAAVHKAHHQGTTASKKKKKAKLQRVMRSMKRQQRVSSENSGFSGYSPLSHLKDAQGFAEKLFSRLQTCNERFEVKMMMLKVIARTVGLHRLILLNFYEFLRKYVQPHQRDVTNLLAAAVQACHDMVPPDAVESLLKQVVNQFVHDRSRTEAIAVGLNVVREMCLRMPLLMTGDLLQDLVLYKKSHEKAVSSAARSLMYCYLQICPSLLSKKDRGRPSDSKAKPKAYGEASVNSNVPGAELLLEHANASNFSDGDDDEVDELATNVSDSDRHDSSEESAGAEENDYRSDEEDEGSEESGEDDGVALEEDDEDGLESEDEIESVRGDSISGDEEDENKEEEEEPSAQKKEEEEKSSSEKRGGKKEEGETNVRKRKRFDPSDQKPSAATSLRALKRLAVEKMGTVSSVLTDGILSNEDFQLIKELKAKKEAKTALAVHGLLKGNSSAKTTSLKVPDSEELSTKRVDPAKLEIHIRRRLTKDERLALVKAGREERGKYSARTAVKQKKTGGSSNRYKEHKKAMPIAAKRSKIARSRQEKKQKQRRAGKQFRGRKAWK
ncbi:protein SDA1 homolog [Amborella trichopoda]|nr:protein SDA1 homolog [Amborella trichopoda]|eukprot:XP_020527660.1 protein SDA1 homolog [Amborella trichopoda]